jgi:23S rRNA pseudoU1915 N3-methylase RlmH
MSLAEYWRGLQDEKRDRARLNEATKENLRHVIRQEMQKGSTFLPLDEETYSEIESEHFAQFAKDEGIKFQENHCVRYLSWGKI